MNLKLMYEIQGGLKANIDYHGEDKNEKMLLALLVELGEAANDWRGFKYWSKNQERKDTLLEEHVDGMHFVLEKGLDLDIQLYDVEPLKCESITKQYIYLFRTASMMTVSTDQDILYQQYYKLFSLYLGLGEMLGFTEEEIFDAYMAKNKINHERQLNGY